MQANTFTIIDAFNQFWKVCGDGDRRALSCAGLTYFYLCSVWNSTGRSISFRRRNTLICAELFISQPTLEKHRNVLKQSGLIDFFSKGRGDPNITYKVLDLRTTNNEVKNENNFNTSFNTSFNSNDVYKQSIELFIVIKGEVKNFSYLKDLFETDVGLKMKWSQNGLPAEKFFDGVELWLQRHHNSEYRNFKEARNHFFNWVPYYNSESEKKQLKSNESHQRSPAGTKAGTGKSAGAHQLLAMLEERLRTGG